MSCWSFFFFLPPWTLTETFSCNETWIGWLKTDFAIALSNFGRLNSAIHVTLFNQPHIQGLLWSQARWQLNVTRGSTQPSWGSHGQPLPQCWSWHCVWDCWGPRVTIKAQRDRWPGILLFLFLDEQMPHVLSSMFVDGGSKSGVFSVKVVSVLTLLWGVSRIFDSDIK